MSLQSFGLMNRIDKEHEIGKISKMILISVGARDCGDRARYNAKVECTNWDNTHFRADSLEQNWYKTKYIVYGQHDACNSIG